MFHNGRHKREIGLSAASLFYKMSFRFLGVIMMILSAVYKQLERNDLMSHFLIVIYKK